MKSGTDLINEAKARVREVSPAEARTLHERGGVTFLDVRDLQEVNLGQIPGRCTSRAALWRRRSKRSSAGCGRRHLLREREPLCARGGYAAADGL